ncbi:uncharacterized protein LOC143285702 [Babylonia areolata]|uniref:uncharacterized protein LOC143285702 n=1 Tax=Babylonia areolata TaxID=304850 RepID=UPI003FD3D534
MVPRTLPSDDAPPSYTEEPEAQLSLLPGRRRYEGNCFRFRYLPTYEESIVPPPPYHHLPMGPGNERNHNILSSTPLGSQPEDNHCACAGHAGNTSQTTLNLCSGSHSCRRRTQLQETRWGDIDHTTIVINNNNNNSNNNNNNSSNNNNNDNNVPSPDYESCQDLQETMDRSLTGPYVPLPRLSSTRSVLENEGGEAEEWNRSLLWEDRRTPKCCRTREDLKYLGYFFPCGPQCDCASDAESEANCTCAPRGWEHSPEVGYLPSPRSLQRRQRQRQQQQHQAHRRLQQCARLLGTVAGKWFARS